jgi:hypothetical protein
MLSAGPVCSCAHFTVPLHTGPRVQRAPGLPCALSSLRGRAIRHNSGASRRGNASPYPRPRPDTISADNHPDLSLVATVWSCLALRNISALAKGAATGQKKPGTRNANGERFDHQGQSLHCRDLRASHPARTRQINRAVARRGRQGRDRGCRAHQSRHRRLFLRRRRPRGPVADGRLPRPQGSPYGFHRYRRLFLFDPCRSRRRSDRGRQVLDRADHPGGQAAHRPDAAARRRRRSRFRGGLRRDHPQRLRHVCHAPYARLRHHQRAAKSPKA